MNIEIHTAHLKALLLCYCSLHRHHKFQLDCFEMQLYFFCFQCLAFVTHQTQSNLADFLEIIIPFWHLSLNFTVDDTVCTIFNIAKSSYSFK